MSTVADRLRAAREAQQLTVHQVAEATKMRTDHVRALEEGNYNVFSAPVYIRGSVRTYAGLLKLDVGLIMDLLDGELSRTDKHHGHPPLDGPPRGILDWIMFQLTKVRWPLVLPAAIIGVFLLGSYWSVRIWRNYKAQDPLSHLGPGQYRPPGKPAGDTLPLPPTHR